mgnify:CR=1 FL=1|jgi:hypothetical protein
MKNKTPEELTELFFTKVKGWTKYFPKEIVVGDADWWWLDKYGKYVGEPEELPKLHESLDLYWLWVLPELMKKLGGKMPKFVEGVLLRLKVEDQAIDFLKASLKALGVL